MCVAVAEVDFNTAGEELGEKANLGDSSCGSVRVLQSSGVPRGHPTGFHRHRKSRPTVRARGGAVLPVRKPALGRCARVCLGDYSLNGRGGFRHHNFPHSQCAWGLSPQVEELSSLAPLGVIGRAAAAGPAGRSEL